MRCHIIFSCPPTLQGLHNAAGSLGGAGVALALGGRAAEGAFLAQERRQPLQRGAA